MFLTVLHGVIFLLLFISDGGYASTILTRKNYTTTEAFKPDFYQNYLTCLALCGKRNTVQIKRTLLSGEIIKEWVKDDKLFDVVSLY
jgi:hypothetical protein